MEKGNGAQRGRPVRRAIQERAGKQCPSLQPALGHSTKGWRPPFLAVLVVREQVCDWGGKSRAVKMSAGWEARRASVLSLTCRSQMFTKNAPVIVLSSKGRGLPFFLSFCWPSLFPQLFIFLLGGSVSCPYCCRWFGPAGTAVAP